MRGKAGITDWGIPLIRRDAPDPGGFYRWGRFIDMKGSINLGEAAEDMGDSTDPKGALWRDSIDLGGGRPGARWTYPLY